MQVVLGRWPNLSVMTGLPGPSQLSLACSLSWKSWGKYPYAVTVQNWLFLFFFRSIFFYNILLINTFLWVEFNRPHDEKKSNFWPWNRWQYTSNDPRITFFFLDIYRWILTNFWLSTKSITSFSGFLFLVLSEHMETAQAIMLARKSST
jgi:hypothetical protein